MRALALALLTLSCAHTAQREPEVSSDALTLHGQKVPEHVFKADLKDFDAAPGVAVLHYYGSGGWGIQWGKTYVLAAPYFSNHSVARLLGSQTVGSLLKVEPKQLAVREGVEGTPIANTTAIIIGHGHVDHTGDVPALFDQGLITTKPALIADASTTNQLAALSARFGCIAPIDFADPEGSAAKCAVEGVRITPIHNAHAPHLNLVGLDVAAFGGFTKEPMHEAPSRSEDFKLGNTWAYLIDLLDAHGKVVFRIHYVDAVGSPPHALVPKELLKERDVDLHIACVPGFEQADYYPDAVLKIDKVKYVLLGHWEDFFQPQSEPLRPLRQVLNEDSMNRFVDIVEREVPHATTVTPLGACSATKPCGPRGEAWALPIPGETFQFATGK